MIRTEPCSRTQKPARRRHMPNWHDILNELHNTQQQHLVAANNPSFQTCHANLLRRPMIQSSQSDSLIWLAKSRPRELKKILSKHSARWPRGDRNCRSRIAPRIDLFHFFPYILSLISLYMSPNSGYRARPSRDCPYASRATSFIRASS
jgi:hypothetical protein